MNVTFQVQEGRNNIASQTYSSESPCSREEGKRLLDRIYEQACDYYSALKHIDEFSDAIEKAKRAIDNAVGGADAGPTRAFYRREFPTRLGTIRVDIEIHRGNGHFRY